jgi:uncharacterized protein YdeI (YjbR/CyaY-like superfamily)
MEILEFASPAEWTAWLAENHAKGEAIWMRIAKKSAGTPSVTHPEALDGALCYGWIDGRRKAESESTWLQMFGPRTRQSIWSKINREKALALIETGKMQPPGMQEIERARADGRWDAAYDGQRTIGVPEDLAKALRRNARAKAFFGKLDSRNRYAVLHRIQTAKKAETRERRIAQFVEMLGRGEKIHP